MSAEPLTDEELAKVRAHMEATTHPNWEPPMKSPPTYPRWLATIDAANLRVTELEGENERLATGWTIAARERDTLQSTVTGLQGVVEQVGECIDHEKFIPGDPDAFWMEWALLREKYAAATQGAESP